jgi:serine/threonine protein kinase
MDQRLATGSILDTFRIVRLIGKGGMGEVYEAYEEMLNRKVALKIIAIESPSGKQGSVPLSHNQQEIIRSFISEGQALAKLNHPNVVTIYRLGVWQKIHYIAMEYVEGRSLKTYISRGEVNLNYALEIFENIVSGVKALHEKNIIHRDLKPKNILISKDKKVKIVDFGISEIQREAQSPNASGKIVGSVFYIPPEVINGKPATLKSDLWNLGVILYEMLTTEKPFYGETPEEILRKAKEKEVAFPLAKKIFIPEMIQKFVLKMCARLPENRYQTIQEIEQDLMAIKGQFTTSAPRSVTSTYTFNSGAVRPVTAPQNVNVKSGGSFLRTAFLGLSAVIILSGAMYYKFFMPNQAIKATEVSTVEAVKTKPELLSPTVTLALPEPSANKPEALATQETIERLATESKAVEVKKEIVSSNFKKIVKIDAPKIITPKLTVHLQFDKTTWSRDVASERINILNAPTLSWRPVPKAQFYLVQIASDLKFTQIIEERITKSLAYQYYPTSVDKLFWRVRASIDGKAFGKHSATSSIHFKLPAPVMHRASFSFTTSTPRQDAVISWYPVPLASYYKFSVSREANGRGFITEKVIDGNKVQYLPPGNGLFYFTVTPLNNEREPAGQVSKPVPLELKKLEVIRMPILQMPRSGVRLTTPVQFVWGSVPEAQFYVLQLSRSREFGTLLLEKSTRSTDFQLTQELAPGPIYWRVRAKGSGSESGWTDPRLLNID